MALRSCLLVFLLALTPALPASEPDGPAPAAFAAQDSAAEVRGRIAASLFFRGEVADLIMNSGEAGQYVDLSGLETYSSARGALMAWIRRDPAAAADVYLRLKGRGGKSAPPMKETEVTWQINADFLEAVKALSDASGSPNVSREAMEMAARRLYGRAQAGDGAPVLDWGGRAPGAGGKARSDFADFRIDKAGLASELASASKWLEALKPAAGDAASAAAYKAALAAYGEFVVASSGLKLVNETGSRQLEELRRRLRYSLAAATLLARAGELRYAAAAVDAPGGPGSAELRSALLGLAGRLEGSASSDRGDMAALGRLVNASEDRFASQYLVFTVYDGLLRLRERVAAAGFSCLYDYAAYRYLAAFFPDSSYAKARKELEDAVPALDEALRAAGAGDPSKALELASPGRIEEAYASVRRASAHNRRVQLFNWGLFFRPVELEVRMKDGRPAFRPVFAIAAALAK